MQDKRALRFDRPPLTNLQRWVTMKPNIMTGEKLSQINVHKAVDQESHRSIITMIDDENNTFFEIGIAELRHRNQKRWC